MNTERRSKVRYPLELAVRYQSLDRQRECGEGRTINVSSGGLLMVAQNQLEEGARMKVTIEWPSLLNGTTPLQLVTIGKVVRRKGPTLAVALEHYQFRTMSRRKAELSSGTVDLGMTIPEPSLETGSYLPGKPSRLRKLPAPKPEQHRAPAVVIG